MSIGQFALGDPLRIILYIRHLGWGKNEESNRPLEQTTFSAEEFEFHNMPATTWIHHFILNQPTGLNLFIRLNYVYLFQPLWNTEPLPAMGCQVVFKGH